MTDFSDRPTTPAPKMEDPWKDALTRATREHTKDALRLALLLEETAEDLALREAALRVILGARRELEYSRNMTGSSENRIDSGAV